jgi:hypothetical protein
MRVVHTNYEYVGFRYEILQDVDGRFYANPCREQHKAAYKEAHCQSAAEQFTEDYEWVQKL